MLSLKCIKLHQVHFLLSQKRWMLGENISQDEYLCEQTALCHLKRLSDGRLGSNSALGTECRGRHTVKYESTFSLLLCVRMGLSQSLVFCLLGLWGMWSVDSPIQQPHSITHHLHWLRG